MCYSQEVKRGRDGLLAVNLIGRLVWLISVLEIWILHSTAPLQEDINLRVCVCVCVLGLRPSSMAVSVLSDLKYR